MKTQKYREIIHLTEVGQEGRKFAYDRESGELNQSLMDLVGSRPYQVEFHIHPLGNAYKVEGILKTSLDLECSKCALDFNMPIEVRLNEVLLVAGGREKPQRGDKQGKVNHATELAWDAPQVYELESSEFDVGEYLHEMLALAEPSRPLGKPDCDDSCENFVQFKKELETKGAPGKFEDSTHPFASLKGLKLS